MPRPRTTRALRLAAAGAVLVALAAGLRLAWLLTHDPLDELVNDWAVDAVAEATGGAYHLASARLRTSIGARRAAFDSLVLSTDSAVNARRADPLAGIHLVLRGCAIEGIGLLQLALRRGLVADRLDCTSAQVTVRVKPGAPAADVAPESLALAPQRNLLVISRRLDLPRFLPRIRLASSTFGNVDFRYTHGPDGGPFTQLTLHRLTWRLTGVIVDPRDSAAAARPLFSRTADVSADSFSLRPDSVTLISIAGLRLSLTDSALAIGRVTWGPTIGDEAFSRRSRWRHDRLRFTLGWLAASGFDYTRLARDGSLRAHTVVLDSLTADIRSDRRLPRNPRLVARLTPQAWAARRPTMLVDSIVFHDARVTYRERREGHGKDAVVLFANIDAVVTNVRHIQGRYADRDTLRFHASSRFLGVAPLTVDAALALDAPRFDMLLSGRLGAMDGAALNAVVEQLQPLRVAEGTLRGVTFTMRVTGGRATGTLTPLYDGFALGITGRGSGGLVASSGLLGRLARTVATWTTNRTRVYRANPEQPGAQPRVGTIDYRMRPEQKLPAFVWFALRGALLETVMRE